MQKIRLILTALLLILFSTLAWANPNEPSNPLPSWKEGGVKNSIIDFVTRVTDKTHSDYIPPDERIATFDNDGTLWVEQPFYTQVMFTFARVKLLAKKHPGWKVQEPFKTILSGNSKAIAKLSMRDLAQLLAVTHSGMSVQDFQNVLKEWLKTAKHPRFDRPYTELIYQPMLEAMNYLRSKDFKVYIVTGGGQDFVRAFAQSTYGVTPNLVIGSIGKTKYVRNGKNVEIVKLPDIFLVDDKDGKPIAINMFIGLHPVIAFGNSDGDREMLEWTQARKGAKLMLLIHHDDAKREYAYGPNSKVGTFSDSLMQEAKLNDWQIISMKNDWKKIFSFE